MLKPIKRTRLYEGVVDQIMNLIRAGTLKPGDQLPSERELAEKFHVSRSSVREALRSLEMMGYVGSKVGIGGGTYVKEITIENIINPFSELLLQKQSTILDLMEVRLTLETQTARLAATRRQKEDLLAIEMSIDEMEREVKEGHVGLIGNNSFHASVAEATHNAVIVKILRMCGDLLGEVNQETLKKLVAPTKASDEHKAIYQAIRSRDAERASSLMWKHIHNAQKNLKNALGIENR